MHGRSDSISSPSTTVAPVYTAELPQRPKQKTKPCEQLQTQTLGTRETLLFLAVEEQALSFRQQAPDLSKGWPWRFWCLLRIRLSKALGSNNSQISAAWIPKLPWNPRVSGSRAWRSLLLQVGSVLEDPWQKRGRADLTRQPEAMRPWSQAHSELGSPRPP